MTVLDDLFEELGVDPSDPLLCHRCGIDPTGRLTETWCANGWCCSQWCPDCGEHWLTCGPAGCRCEAGGPNPLWIDGHAYRRRTRRRRP